MPHQSEGFHLKNCDIHLKGETPQLTLRENYSLYVQMEKKQRWTPHLGLKFWMFSGLVLVLGFGGFCFCLFSPELPLPPSNVKLAGFWNWVLLSFASWKPWICTSHVAVRSVCALQWAMSADASARADTWLSLRKQICQEMLCLAGKLLQHEEWPVCGLPAQPCCRWRFSILIPLLSTCKMKPANVS